MTELVLFIVVGALAVAAAVMMLLSENAVHSALFLIVTMGCLAFLFLLLNAPFLAMIQITVYAGAIMVLFLFVIMLLGAEKLVPSEPGPGGHKYRWFTPIAITLSMALMIAVGLGIVSSQIDLLETPEQDPLVRVVNVAQDHELLSVFANGTEIASGLTFAHSSEFLSVPQGEHTLSFAADGAAASTITLEPNTAQTLVVYGDGETPSVAVVPADLETVDSDRSLRYSVFNAYSGAPSVSLVDFGSDFDDEDTREIISALPYGQQSEVTVRREGEVDTWAYLNAENTSEVLVRVRDFNFERQTDSLLIMAEEPLFDGTTRPVQVPVISPTEDSFGGPRAIGELLFTDYMLPFQLLAVLLLASMVGAIVLTHRETDKSRRKQTGRRKVARPLANVIASQVGHDVVDQSPEQSAGD